MSEMTSGEAPPHQPWYHAGLRFSCTQCGNCCTGTPGYVWVEPDELQSIADFLQKSVGEIRLLHTRPVGSRLSLNEFANGDCTWLDPQSRRCRIYPVRPRQCRTWPFWHSNIETPEAWERTSERCPGAGCGELVSISEIEKRSGEIDL